MAGKLVVILVAVIALWVGVNVIEDGPEQVFGGLFDAFTAPQYGEADPPTRETTLADEVLREAGD